MKKKFRFPTITVFVILGIVFWGVVLGPGVLEHMAKKHFLQQLADYQGLTRARVVGHQAAIDSPSQYALYAQFDGDPQDLFIHFNQSIVKSGWQPVQILWDDARIRTDADAGAVGWAQYKKNTFGKAHYLVVLFNPEMQFSGSTYSLGNFRVTIYDHQQNPERWIEAG